MQGPVHAKMDDQRGVGKHIFMIHMFADLSRGVMCDGGDKGLAMGRMRRNRTGPPGPIL